MANEQDPKEAARQAIYEAIPRIIKETQEEASGTAQAEALHHLAEAFAWAVAPTQPH